MKDLKQYTAQVRAVLDTYVLIEAYSLEEAAEKAEDGDYIELDFVGASIADYAVMSPPKEV